MSTQFMQLHLFLTAVSIKHDTAQSKDTKCPFFAQHNV